MRKSRFTDEQIVAIVRESEREGVTVGQVAICWNEYASSTRMLEARTKAFMLHLATCIVVAASSLLALRR